ncbi:MAG: NAD(P)/FAD-dependent oxidoreductase [Puniceicoccaceae bacterium]
MSGNKKRIAVVGAGISGLGAAYLLREHADVTLYEKNNYLGGHSRTLEVDVFGKPVPVDTGFIVYNERNYPLLSALFKELEVPVVNTDMSFGVSVGNGWLEYSSYGLKGMFGSLRNAASPKMYSLVGDILRFNREAGYFKNVHPSLSLGQCLDLIGVGDWFRNYYLLPMGGSIWSCPVEQMLSFPASTFIRFFENHGLLTLKDHPQWYSVKGGAREYVRRMMDRMSSNVDVRHGAKQITRMEDRVQVMEESGEILEYDDVIIASHPDEALELIENPSLEEEEVLSSFTYQPNKVVLHTDLSFMPKRRSAWASWVYQSNERVDTSNSISLSYWMNNLQDLETDVPLIVTLNPSREPKEGTVLDSHWFNHPVFDKPAVLAQEKIMDIQGKDRLWFCGAYQRNGFHEDGLWSAVRVAKTMGIELTWK